MSYSRRDEAVMRRVVDFLRSRGIDVWVDNEELIPGTPIWETEIEKAIFGASAAVVILSPDSKASEWVRREISYTERYQKRIFPVLVRGDENSSISIRLTNHQYVDIRHDEQLGLERLGTALLFYLEDLETRKRRALEDAEKQAQEQAKREQEKREAVRLRLERERAEKERVDRRRIAQKWAEKEKVESQKSAEKKPTIKQTESKAETAAATPPQGKRTPYRGLVPKGLVLAFLNFRWFPVLLTALGWSVSVSFGVFLLEMLLNIGGSQPTSFQLIRSVVGILIGALGGLLTALSLWLANIISQKKSIFVITLGWAMGWVVGWIASFEIITATRNGIGGPLGGAIGGVIGGLAIAYSLWDEKVISHWKSMLIVVLGWSFGWALAEAFYLMSNGALIIEFIGLLIGVIGGTVLIWQTETRLGSPDSLKHPIWGPVLGITLGWAFGLPAEAIGYDFGWEIGLAATGAIAGGVTGVSLLRGKILSQWKTVLWIALGWMLALLIGHWVSSSIGLSIFMFGFIQGALGSLSMVLFFRAERLYLGWRQIITIILVWGISMGIYRAAPQFVLRQMELSQFTVEEFLSLSAALIILLRALIGALGGYILIQQIRAEKTS